MFRWPPAPVLPGSAAACHPYSGGLFAQLSICTSPYFPGLSPFCSAWETQPQHLESQTEPSPVPPQHSFLMDMAQIRLHSCPQSPCQSQSLPLDHAPPYRPTPRHIRCVRGTGKDIQGLPHAEAMLQAKHMGMIWLFFSFLKNPV